MGGSLVIEGLPFRALERLLQSVEDAHKDILCSITTDSDRAEEVTKVSAHLRQLAVLGRNTRGDDCSNLHMQGTILPRGSFRGYFLLRELLHSEVLHKQTLYLFSSSL